MMNLNRSAVMSRAWRIFRKETGITFSEALRRAWASEKAAPVNAARIEAAKAAAGITEVVATWADWKRNGYEVNHGSKALFQVTLVYASKGDGAVYKASFFGLSQVHAIEEEAAA